MLQVRLQRKYPAFMTAICAVLLVSVGSALAEVGGGLPGWVRLFAWLMVVAMAFGLTIGLRQLLWPPLMYRADRDGVMIYYAADRRHFGGRGVFLPWKSVTGMAFEKRLCAGTTSSKVNIWVVVCALNGKAPFPVAQHSAACEDDDRVVCLDAISGTPSGQAMLAELQHLWAVARG